MAGFVTTRQIPINSVSLFQQASAPINWTRITTYNDMTIRLVNSGNTVVTNAQSFSTVFTPTPQPFGATTLTAPNSAQGGATTLTTAQIPSHSHSLAPPPSWNRESYPTILTWVPGPAGTLYQVPGSGTFQTDGGSYGGGSHSHPQSFSGPATVPFAPGTVNFAVQYVDLLLCQRSV